jgi:hypothetical protein
MCHVCVLLLLLYVSSTHIHVSYYCVLFGSRRTKVLLLLCGMYVSSSYYYMCPQLILVLHAGGRVYVEIKNTL